MSGITVQKMGLVPEPPRLLDQLRQTALTRFGRPEPAARYVEWVRAFILFHGKRHPGELGLAEVSRFLEHLAPVRKRPITIHRTGPRGTADVTWTEPACGRAYAESRRSSRARPRDF